MMATKPMCSKFGCKHRLVAVALMLCGTAIHAGPLPARSTRLAIGQTMVDATIAPLGLDNQRPTISWTLEDPNTSAPQTAYRIKVFSTGPGGAATTVWDSGRVASTQPRGLYAGTALRTSERYSYSVMIWTTDGKRSEWSLPASWEMGLLAQADWHARWIRAAGVTTIREAYAGHDFRRAFTLPDGVRSARLHVAATGMLRHCLNRPFPQSCRVAAGLVVAFINGHRVGDHQLDPAPSDKMRALYSTYDVASLLQPGQNVIGLSEGGDGDLIARLDITLHDGRRVSVATDADWSTRQSASTHVDRFAGTDYDARREQAGWDLPGFSPGPSWSPVLDSTNVVSPITLSSAATLPPMRIIKRLKPISIVQTSKGAYTIDFGQNISGRVHFRLKGRSGDILSVTHAERLDGRGEADLYSTGFFGLQTDNYTLADREADWSPGFAYYGFRYATIRGLASAPRVDQIWAEQVNTDLQSTGELETSDPQINAIHHAALQTTLNNVHGIPEDCPHREKRGWMADGYVSAPQALANFDMNGFYAKWLTDIRDAQRPNGAATDIAPAETSYQRDGDSSWGAAIVFLPWDVYQQSGDLDVLRSNYDNMRRFVDWTVTQAKGFLLPVGGYRGDWASFKNSDDGVVRNGVWYMAVSKAADAARLLGHMDDANRLDALSRSIRAAYNASYLDRASASYGTPGKQEATTSQASLALPIVAGIVPDDMQAAVTKRFANYVQTISHNHVESGLTATIYVMEALRKIGRQDLFHAMVKQRDMPSWTHMIESGPGTLWEGWNEGSRNHAWPGIVDAYFYKIYGGIESTSPGFRTVDIRPYAPKGLEWVQSSEITPFGALSSSWRRTEKGINLDIVVPSGVTARVFVPGPGHSIKVLGVNGPRARRMDDVVDKRFFQVTAGVYQFRITN